MKPITARYTELIPDYGDVMTVESFLDAVKSGAFIDYDGIGRPAKDGQMAYGVYIKPSNTGNDIPEDATHVIWFNK